MYELQIFTLNLLGWLFTLLIVFFDAQKFLFLIKSNLSIFTSVACAFGVISEKLWSKPMLRNFLPVVSSRSFMIAHLMFKSLIYFKLILGVVSVVQFNFLHVIISFPTKEFCWKDCPFLFSILGSLVKYRLTVNAEVYFWDLYLVPLFYVSLFMPVLSSFNYDSFVV